MRIWSTLALAFVLIGCQRHSSEANAEPQAHEQAPQEETTPGLTLSEQVVELGPPHSRVLVHVPSDWNAVAGGSFFSADKTGEFNVQVIAGEDSASVQALIESDRAAEIAATTTTNQSTGELPPARAESLGSGPSETGVQWMSFRVTVPESVSEDQHFWYSPRWTATAYLHPVGAPFYVKTQVTMSPDTPSEHFEVLQGAIQRTRLAP